MLHPSRLALVGFFAVAVTLARPLLAAETAAPSRAEDTVAIQQLVVKYAHVYDALDVEGYVSVFTDDAEFKFTGNTLKGKDDIRKFITGAKQRKDSAPATDKPTRSFHSLSNTLIEFTGPNEARHRSYWQVLSGPASGPFTITGMGYYDDVVVKRDGKWLIRSRNIP